MRCTFTSLTLAALLAPILSAQPGIHPDELKIKPEVDAAIHRGVDWLIETQLRDGTWGRFRHYNGGKTALCAYALLKSGVAANHPAIRRAFLSLGNIRPHETYTAACMMLAYAASGLSEYEPRLKELTSLLLRWQHGGDYGYPFHHNGNSGFTRPDLSNTQYAALGLWIGQKHGLKIPGKVWRGLAIKTLRYRERPQFIKVKRQGKHTVSVSKAEIAGFGYVPGRKPTGSMTTAGIGVLQICKIGLGSRIPVGLRRRIDHAVECGVAWLGHHFAVDKNPFKKDWTFYYLYGLERVGSLTRVEKMGEHWWYLRGARHLLAKQGKDGSWHRGADREIQTSFALLFLRRATRYAAVTGGSGGGGPRHLFSAGDSKADATIGGVGQQPLAIWIKDFGAGVKQQHKAFGIRVVQVEYLQGERVLGQLAGKPHQAWTHDAFLHRIPALPRGVHKLRARITLVAADTPRGATEPTVQIESAVMSVDIRDIMAGWMEAAANLASNNLIRGFKVKGTASTHAKHARRAADNKEATHWACAAKDGDPRLTLEFEKLVTANKLVLTQAGSRAIDLGKFSSITAVEVRINRSKKGLVFKLDPDPLAVNSFELPKTRRIRRLDIRILGRHPAGKPAGFAEVGLTR